MIHFEWPWLFLLCPLPWFYRRLLKPVAPNQSGVLRVPFLQDFGPLNADKQTRLTPRWALWMAVCVWVLLVTASTRPQWLGDLVQLPLSGRDLMLAVDLSGSMEEPDFQRNGKFIDRLTATKWVAADFIEHRQGDRIGLILFGEQAYLQTPLTFDLKTVQTLLFEAVIGLAGQATAIGDAIGLAVKRLRQRKHSNKVLILLTDGANTAGTVSPLDAADLAAKENLKIYTIGIGADEMIVRDFFGSRRINPSADLDEATLKAIAKKTGGRYFRARDTDELRQIYKLLDKLEPVEKDLQHFRPRIALYPWPLGAALGLGALLMIAQLRG
jgi:Ca-activated chloride channel homolog